MQLGYHLDLERWVVHFLLDDDGEVDCLANFSIEEFAAQGVELVEQTQAFTRLAARAVELKQGECTLSEIDAALRKMMEEGDESRPDH